MNTKALKEPLLVSACLAGIACRYDGKSKLSGDFEALAKDRDIYLFCPEVEGGLETPRPPAEIVGDKVVNSDGKDVTAFYERGARKALELCRQKGIKKAVLKSKSPSCSKKGVYDGSFSGALTAGKGVTARLLMDNGVEVFDESEISLLLGESHE